MYARLVPDEDSGEGAVGLEIHHPGQRPYLISLDGGVEGELEDCAPENRPPKFILDFMQRRPPSVKQEIDWDRFTTEKCRTLIKPYQRAAFLAAVQVHNGRSLVGMEQGTGKTIVGSCVLSFYGGLVLIIGPSGKRGDWISEVKDWTGLVVQDLQKKKQKLTHDIVFCSFDMAKVHPEVLARNWHTVIVDESHKLKEVDTIRCKMLMPILQKAKVLMLLSGTPQTSKPAELYTQLAMLHPAVFVSRDAFLQRYCDRKQNKAGEWEATGCRNGKELSLVLAKLMTRVTRAQALPVLPPLERVLIKFRGVGPGAKPELKPEMDKYKQEERKFFETAKNLKAVTAGNEYRAKTLLMQIKMQANRLNELTGQIKLKACWDWILADMAKFPGEKAVMFASHLKIVADAAAYMRDHGKMEVVEITGEKVPPKKRMVLLESMRSRATLDKGPRVAVLSLGSSAEGLNLCGASRMYILELANTAQAECRIHRIGTEIPVTVMYMFLDDSYDGKSLNKLVKRSKVCNLVVDGEDEPTLTFAREEYAHPEAAQSAASDEADAFAQEHITRMRVVDQFRQMAASLPLTQGPAKRGRYTFSFTAAPPASAAAGAGAGRSTKEEAEEDERRLLAEDMSSASMYY